MHEWHGRRRRLAPAQARQRGYRFAAYRRCSVDAETLEQRNGLRARADEPLQPTSRRSRVRRRRGVPQRRSAAQRGRVSPERRELWGTQEPCIGRPDSRATAQTHLARPARTEGNPGSPSRTVRVWYSSRDGVGYDHGARSACATERGDEADEAQYEAERGMVVGRRRGCAVIVHGPQGARASQLMAGVGRT